MRKSTSFSDNSFHINSKYFQKTLKLHRKSNKVFHLQIFKGLNRLISFLDYSLRLILISLIKIYQRRLSPIKGYSCAHRITYGSESCSKYVENILADTSLFEATVLTRKRFQACNAACKSLKQSKQLTNASADFDPDLIAQCIAGIAALLGACAICGKNRR